MTRSSRTAAYAAMHVGFIGFKSLFTYRWWLKAIALGLNKYQLIGRYFLYRVTSLILLTIM